MPVLRIEQRRGILNRRILFVAAHVESYVGLPEGGAAHQVRDPSERNGTVDDAAAGIEVLYAPLPDRRMIRRQAPAIRVLPVTL